MPEQSTFVWLRNTWLQKLRLELSENLHYHGHWHTEDVLRTSSWLADQLAIDSGEKLLLQTAALFHDTGFLVKSEEHEYLSCSIAREALLPAGYSASEIAQIEQMILATKIPQSPKNHLSAILCDADLAYLGTPDYFTIAARLREEWRLAGRTISDNEWLNVQIGFFRSHAFFTQAAKDHFNDLKNRNLILLEDQKGVGS